jgi:DNA-binding protein H-NS
MANDLKSMSKKQLEKLQKDVQKALKSIQTKEKREAKKAAERAAAKFGFSLSELTDAGTAKPGRKKSGPKTVGKAKFANPDDPKQTWTGKGRQPTWYKAAMDAGKDPKSLEI